MTLETPVFLVIPSRIISNMVLPPPLLLPRSCNPPHRRIGHRRSWRKWRGAVTGAVVKTLLPLEEIIQDVTPKKIEFGKIPLEQ